MQANNVGPRYATNTCWSFSHANMEGTTCGFFYHCGGGSKTCQHMVFDIATPVGGHDGQDEYNETEEPAGPYAGLKKLKKW